MSGGCKGESKKDGKREREKGTDGGCVCVFVFSGDQGQYMALSSTALTIRIQKNQRPETKTTRTEV